MEQQIQQPIQEKTENKPPIKTNTSTGLRLRGSDSRSSVQSWKFIAIVVVLGLVASGGILLLQAMRTPPAMVSQNSIIKTDTSDWQTYRNEEFGFEVKYPSHWFVPDWEISKTPKEEIPKQGILWFRVQIATIEGEIELPEIFIVASKIVLQEKLFPASYTKSSQEKIKVAGKDTWKEKWKGDASFHLVVRVISDNGIYYRIQGDFPTSESYEKYLDLYNQILSTFRFVENNVQVQECKDILDVDKRVTCWVNELSADSRVFQCRGVPHSPQCYAQLGALKNDSEICEKAGLYSYMCKIGVAEQNPFYSPEEAKSIIADRAIAVMRALKGKDMEELAAFVHAQKPLRFWSIDDSFVLPKEKIPSFFTDQAKHNGAYDGSGFPFTFAQTEYYDDYIYDRDYLNAPQVSYDLRYMSSATTGGGQFQRYGKENPITVTYAFPQSSDDAASDWRNLRLWFTEENRIWYLREIMQNQWAI